MRFAQNRISPHKHASPSKYLNKSPRKSVLFSESTYVHYNNGIYMGGMSSYKRNGQGIALLDDGSSLISQYCFDSMTGHNIIFRENCILSVLFLKNSSCEIAVRTGQCVIKIPLLGKDAQANGNGVLVDFHSMKMYHLLFQSGRVVRKIVESNRSILDRVMSQQLHAIMDQRHEQALKARLSPGSGIKVLREGRRMVVGFADSRHCLEGVGFKLRVNEDYDDLTCPLELKCLERGFYRRSRLQGYGERSFSNGNLYIGEFEDDLFNGQGLLLYPQEEKWVWGLFEGERLRKMLSTSLDNPTHCDHPSRPRSMRACLREIHEFNSKDWIDNEIAALDWEGMKQVFAEAFAAKVTDVVVERERAQREEEERLGRIQAHFSSELPGRGIDLVVEEQMSKARRSVEKVLLPESALTPQLKVLRVEPRNAENQDYWSTAVPASRLSPHSILTPAHSNCKTLDAKWRGLCGTSPSKGGRSPYKRFCYPNP